MKKIVFTMALIIVFNNIALADGNAFTPLNFGDTSYGNSSAPIIGPTTTTTTTGSDIMTLSDEAIGNGNIQNAISQLENAQVDIRNDLLNCKTKYADVDAQYKLIKAERASIKKQISSIERRIKDIERAKNKIRSNML